MNTSSVITFLIIAALILLVWEILDRLVTPWLSKRWVDKLLADIDAGRIPKRTDFDFEIKFDEASFSSASLKKPSAQNYSMRWIDVEKIVAFKRDLLSADCICLFLSRADNSGLELDEDMKGWCEFTEAMPKHLPTCKPLQDWIFDIATPAFATNLTELYSRSTAKTEAANKTA